MQDIMVAAKAVLEKRGISHTLTDQLKTLKEPRAPWSRYLVAVPAINIRLEGEDFTIYLGPWRGALGSSTMVAIGPSDGKVEHLLEEILNAIRAELRSTPRGGP